MQTLPLSVMNASSVAVPGFDPWYAHPQDPALSVMTDFREHTSITVADEATIEAALEHMKHMVLASIPRHEVRVRDIMQPIAKCLVADIEHLRHTTVAAVARMFAESGLTHVPVVETTDGGQQRLRGLLSAARVKRVLSGYHVAASPAHAAFLTG